MGTGLILAGCNLVHTEDHVHVYATGATISLECSLIGHQQDHGDPARQHQDGP